MIQSIVFGKWTYDKVGNRLTQWNGSITTTYTYNDANQLVSELTNGLVTVYEYDANGNQVKRTKGTEISTWLYDYENRQISYADSLNKGFYGYDAGGRRIKHTSVITRVNQNAASKIGVGQGKGQGKDKGKGTQNAISNQYETITTTEKYIYDGANIIADYQPVSGIWNPVSTYLTPFLDQNLLTTRGLNTYYFMADGLGSVRDILDSNQTVKNSYDYLAFGESLSWNESIPNRYTYTSREWDSESSTYYYRARQYNPSVGRFTVRDPIEYMAGIGLYTYVWNNPVRYSDPSGLARWWDYIIGLPIVIAVNAVQTAFSAGAEECSFSDEFNKCLEDFFKEKGITVGYKPRFFAGGCGGAAVSGAGMGALTLEDEVYSPEKLNECNDRATIAEEVAHISQYYSNGTVAFLAQYFGQALGSFISGQGIYPQGGALETEASGLGDDFEKWSKEHCPCGTPRLPPEEESGQPIPQKNHCMEGMEKAESPFLQPEYY